MPSLGLSSDNQTSQKSTTESFTQTEPPTVPSDPPCVAEVSTQTDPVAAGAPAAGDSSIPADNGDAGDTVPETGDPGSIEPTHDGTTTGRREAAGTKEDPFTIEDDFDNHSAISDDEGGEAPTEPAAVEEDKIFFGSAFEKVEEFDHHIDDKSPWHADLVRPLFDSQIIGFRWMVSRHAKGGGLIGDKVGCGKVPFLRW
jgi:hypothetical protein